MRTSEDEEEEEAAQTMNTLTREAITPRRTKRRIETSASVPRAETAARALPNRQVIIVEESSDEEGAPIDTETIRRQRAKLMPWVKTRDYVEKDRYIPAIIFEDYMSPFSSLLGMNGGEERIQAIAKKSNLLLAAVSGKYAPPEKGRLIEKSVRSLVSNKDSVAVTQPTGRETWWVVEVASQEEREKVLEAKSMWSTERKVMVIFRKISKRPQKRRFTVVELPVGVEQHHVTAALTDKYGATEITWDRANERDSRKWIIGLSIEDKKQRAAWIHREALDITDETMKVSETIVLVKAPHCVVCHGEDHVRQRCEWRAIFGNVNLSWGVPVEVPNRGDKPAASTNENPPPAPEPPPVADTSSLSAAASSSGNPKST